MKTRVSVFVLLIVIVVFVGPSWGFYEGYNDNNYFGISAGASNTSGFSNSFFGTSAGQYNITNSYNSFFGHYAGLYSKGDSNSFFGHAAGIGNNIGSHNSFFGESAGGGFLDMFSINGYYNSCFGNIACRTGRGSYNSIFGNSAGYSNIGSYNSFFGNLAGYSNIEGEYNNFIGNTAGYSNTYGSSNSFVGHNAGYYNTTGNRNSFLGNNAGVFHSTGDDNTFIGFQAGANNLSGSGNVFIGYYAGNTETGSNKLYIDNGFTTSPLIYGDFSAGTLAVNGALTATSFTGNGAGLTNVSATTCANTTEIGALTANDIPRWNGIQLIPGIVLDNGITAAVNGKLTVSALVSVSDERYKRNIKPLQLSLEKLTHLTGVSYDWKAEEYSGKGFTEERQIGLIAQDVKKVFPELVTADDKGYLAIEYTKLVPVLIEAVKEQQVTLKEQQASIKQKDSRIEKLEKALELMEQRLTSLESQSQKISFTY